LPDFGRYNLIYGWNWTGKTTLSRLFRALELRRIPSLGEAVLHIDGADVRGEDFPHFTLPIRVFNRDFIQESVFPVGGGDLPPIFVVGKESVQKQKEVDQLKADMVGRQQDRDNANRAKAKADRDLDQHCIDRAGVIRDTLRKTGSAYNNYDKTDYRRRAEKMTADGDAAFHRLSDEQRESLLAQHQASPKPKVLVVIYQIPELQALADQIAALLRTTVVSSGIQTLKDDSKLAEWVRHGLGLHKDRHSNKCLFCEQPLPAARLSELEAHFNAEYDRFLRQIDDKIQSLKSAKKQAAELRLPDRAALYDDLATEYDAAELTLRQAIDAVQTFLDGLISALNDKKSQPFNESALVLSVPEVDVAAVDRLNEVIRKHNQACDNFERRADEARDRLALNMIAESLVDFVRLRNAVQTATAAVGPIEADIRRLTEKIESLEQEIREHRRPAEELNKDLKQYLGHSELQLTIKDNGYSITRNGVPAEMLSEGETTAIALLYFLKSLEDRSFDKRNGIVILDDPVSSLDANALYLAFGFIRHRTQDAGQLFVLTHNFQFFRQVRNWFNHQKGQNKKDVNQHPSRFYMLDRVTATTSRRTKLCALDPLLKKYESEYHYLFACVHRAASATGDVALEQNYCLPNLARRLLEMFLAFRRPQIAGELWQKLKDITFDETKKVRIARFVHTYSHSDTIGEPEHDPSLLGEARDVLVDLLEMIKSEDPIHFEAMVGLVCKSIGEEASK
jgi:wobble nucleotide-excising tRNase